MVGCGRNSSRLQRMIFFTGKIYREACKLDCDIYHLHDPELLRYGLKLKRKGKKVIFDSHEDVPAQIMDKPWIASAIRKFISACYRKYETYVVKRIDAVVAATPYIAGQFAGRARKVVTVNNYPKLDDIVFHDTPFEQREKIICYAGGISKIRGEEIMVQAMKDVDGVLILAGEHEKTELGGVKYLGHIDRAAVNKLYGQAVAGFILLLPTANYRNSLPIKMFEYMAAGLPFIASDFPMWQEIVQKHHCGICVSVNDLGEIRRAVTWILSHREEAGHMGENGRRVVEKNCNWHMEERKLTELYKDLGKELGGRYG